MPDDPKPTDSRAIADSFADPNAGEDTRLGKSFAETNASRKPHRPRERRHEQGSRRWLWIGLAAAAVLFLAALLIGGLPRYFRERDLKKEAEQRKSEKIPVEAIRVTASHAGAAVVLPGTTIPLTEAYVYARANGYLKTRLVDIGDHVRKGQLLAVIEAPDLDAQVDQAREQLRQAEQQLENQRSQLALQKVTLERYRVLVAKGVLSRQQGDQQETNYATQAANVAAADRNVNAFKANLDRAIALQSYEQVRAPFAGVVTQRSVDVGALISASGTSSGAPTGGAPTGQFSSTGGSQQAGQSNNAGTGGSVSTAATTSQSPGQGGPLFGIADQTRLRILVSVPESYAAAVHPGAHTSLSMQEFPNRTIPADVTRTSRSIDPNTRTLLTEVQVDNHDGKLIPGMYTVVTFPPVPGVQGPLTILGDAIAVRKNSPSVAKIENGRVHFVPVVVGRDFGDVVEIVSGLRAGDVIVAALTDQVVDGREVEPRFKEQTNQTEGNDNSTGPKAGPDSSGGGKANSGKDSGNAAGGKGQKGGAQ